MNLWPSRKQWHDWQLPSKLTAIGTYIGVIALVLSIILFIFSGVSQRYETHGNQSPIVLDNKGTMTINGEPQGQSTPQEKKQ